MKAYRAFTTPEDGELTFSPVEQEQFDDFLEYHDGNRLWLEIEAKTPTRSQRQHKFYWVYIEHLSEQTGYAKYELHNEFKHQFLPWTKAEGITDTYESQPSTKDLSKKEFNEYIRNIEEATGIQAPSKSRYGLT